ncbi:MAG: hypothetical protein RDU14_15320 [Melioribacteraceae bacterium]|nr:hypothetical protein [Melioribacteraceae bacterium]
MYNSNLLKNIYLYSPSVFKDIYASTYGLLIRKKRYGPDFVKQYKLLKSLQFESNSTVLKYQLFLYKDFLKFSFDNSPFYGIWAEKKIQTIEDIKQMAVLSKQVVRENIKQIIPSNINKIKHIWTCTSGTTGKSLNFPISAFSFQREFAFRALHYSWSNVDLLRKDPIAFCAGHPVAYIKRKKPPFWVYDYFSNWLLFSSYHMSESNLKYYVEKLETFSPKMLAGYPSSIYLLGLAYKKYGKKKLNLNAIYTGSENLFNHQRKLIEDAFQVKVFNWYGNSEFGANIVECERGSLHLKLEYSFIEILNDSNQDCKPGETGRLVCTAFGNYAFPLIRYDIGDSVTLSLNQNCECGRSGRIIEKIEGRNEDYIETPDGRLVGRLDHLFKHTTEIIEAQIIQNNKNGIILNIVCPSEFRKEQEKILKREIEVRLGNSMNFEINYVNELERTIQGKAKFIISKINKS